MLAILDFVGGQNGNREFRDNPISQEIVTLDFQRPWSLLFYCENNLLIMGQAIWGHLITIKVLKLNWHALTHTHFLSEKENLG